MEPKKALPKYYLSKRIFAGVIDYGLWFILFYFSCVLFGEKIPEGGFKGDHLILFFICIWIVLMIVTEFLIQSTIGNLIVGLKAINQNGTKAKLWQYLVRHSMDLIDMWPLGGVGILLIKVTKQNQRLGDLLAKTIVVQRTK